MEDWMTHEDYSNMMAVMGRIESLLQKIAVALEQPVHVYETNYSGKYKTEDTNAKQTK
jgi:hypothetical protein